MSQNPQPPSPRVSPEPVSYCLLRRSRKVPVSRPRKRLARCPRRSPSTSMQTRLNRRCRRLQRLPARSAEVTSDRASSLQITLLAVISQSPGNARSESASGRHCEFVVESTHASLRTDGCFRLLLRHHRCEPKKNQQKHDRNEDQKPNRRRQKQRVLI